MNCAEKLLEPTIFFNLYTFSFCSQTKCWLSGLEFTKCLSLAIANRDDPDQTASSEAVRSASALFVRVFLQATMLKSLEYLL